ncbi:hypothetical protein PTKIN_Ptkin03bG0250100 [Pterospermum kingtungense]
MCHANINPSAGKRGLVVQRRWLLLQASIMAAAAAHHAPGTGLPRENGGAGSIRRCLCSPTKHPGSFRCRHHHAEYVWGGRFVSKK